LATHFSPFGTLAFRAAYSSGFISATDFGVTSSFLRFHFTSLEPLALDSLSDVENPYSTAKSSQALSDPFQSVFKASLN